MSRPDRHGDAIRRIRRWPLGPAIAFSQAHVLGSPGIGNDPLDPSADLQVAGRPIGISDGQRHGRLDLPEHQPVFNTFSSVPVISISNAQRRPVPQANWLRTIHHGLPEKLLTPQPATPSYLAVLGRIAPEKGVDRAIRIAIRCGIPLKIAAKVDRADQEYYDEVVRPLMDHPLIEYIGEIGDHEKSNFLSGAIGLLVPIDWPEPFGLVMIEAIACGTPVIAFNCGSVPEVMDDGLTGFIVNNVDQAVKALGKVDTLDRAKVRATFDRRWTSRRMAEDYVDVYQSLAVKSKPRLRALSA